MSLLWLEGFETFTNNSSGYSLVTDLTRKYLNVSSASLQTSTGRYSGISLQSIGTRTFRTPLFDSVNEVVIGFALNPGSTQTTGARTTIVEFRNMADESQCLIGLTYAGQLTFERGSTILGTSARPGLTQNAWHYIEVYVKVANSGGNAVVRLDGNEILNISGVDSLNGTIAGVTHIHFELIDSFLLDDIYVCNVYGDYNNSFLGDIKILPLTPNGDGATTDWTSLGMGAHYTEVDEAEFDSGTSYVYTSTISNEDLYDVTDVSGIDEAAGVQLNYWIRKVYENNRTSRGLVKSGVTTQELEERGVPNDYACFGEAIGLDPETNLPWTIVGINNGQFGVKLES